MTRLTPVIGRGPYLLEYEISLSNHTIPQYQWTKKLMWSFALIFAYGVMWVVSVSA